MFLCAAAVASLLKAYPLSSSWSSTRAPRTWAMWGLTRLRGAWRRWRDRNDPGTPRLIDAAGPAVRRSPFRKALVISLLDPTYPWPALSFLLLGLIAQVTSALHLTALILADTFLAAQFSRRRRLAAGATSAVGALFLGFGLKLAQG
jgi:leucine efflux protein